MPIIERISEMFLRAKVNSRNFPATTLYNEGWLLRLTLDWYSRHRDLGGHALAFAKDGGWFSEAQLPTQFRGRIRGDRLAESRTHADGVIGHVIIGANATVDLILRTDASQLVVTEAKLFSPLAPGVANAPFFNQAARTVA
jgi:hypothetical protein